MCIGRSTLTKYQLEAAGSHRGNHQDQRDRLITEEVHRLMTGTQLVIMLLNCFYLSLIWDQRTTNMLSHWYSHFGFRLLTQLISLSFDQKSDVLRLSYPGNPMGSFPLRDYDFVTIGCMVLGITIPTHVCDCDVANKWVLYPF